MKEFKEYWSDAAMFDCCIVSAEDVWKAAQEEAAKRCLEIIRKHYMPFTSMTIKTTIAKEFNL